MEKETEIPLSSLFRRLWPQVIRLHQWWLWRRRLGCALGIRTEPQPTSWGPIRSPVSLFTVTLNWVATFNWNVGQRNQFSTRAVFGDLKNQRTGSLGWMMKLLIWQEVTQYWVGSSHYPIQLSNDPPLSSTRDTLQWNLIPIVKRQLTVDSSPSASEVCLSDTSPCVCLAAWVQRQQLHFAFHVDRFKDICQRRLQWQSFFSFALRIRFN